MIPKTQKHAWWKIGYGKLDRQMQADFERAQKIAQESGQACTLSLTIKVEPPKPKEPEYMAVSWKRKLSEPAYASSDVQLVIRNGVAVAEAEQHPDQTLLELEDTSDIGARRQKALAT